MVGKALSKGAQGVGRALIRNIPDEALVFIKQMHKQGVDVLDQATYGTQQAVLQAVDKAKGIYATLKAQQPQAPDPATLYPIAQKAKQAFEAVRESVSARYGVAAERAMEEPARASLAGAGQFMKMNLRAKALIDAKGQALPGPSVNRPFTGEERLLLGIYDDIRGMSPHPVEGLPGAVKPGTFINYDRAIRLLDRLDEAMASAKTRNTQRIIGGVRQRVMDGLKASDQGLAKVVPEYGRFVGMRDTLDVALADPDNSASLLNRSSGALREGLLKQLEQLDALAPAQSKFYQDLVAFQQATDAAKAAQHATKTIDQMVMSQGEPGIEGLVTRYFNQPETIKRALGAIEQLAGQPFIQDFKANSAARYFSQSGPSTLTKHGIIEATAMGAYKRGVVPWSEPARRAGEMAVGTLSSPAMRLLYGAGARGTVDETFGGEN